MKLPTTALALVALAAACKESRPSGLTSSDVPIVIGDTGSPNIDIPSVDVPAADRPATDATPGVDTAGPARHRAPRRGAVSPHRAALRGLRALAAPDLPVERLRGATSYRVEYSTTRAFTAVESSATSATTTLTPAADLPRGLRWWRVVGLSGASTLRTTVAWPVTIGRARHDLNGDGRADVVIGAPGRDTGVGTPTGEVYVHFGAQPMAASPEPDAHRVRAGRAPRHGALDLRRRQRRRLRRPARRGRVLPRGRRGRDHPERPRRALPGRRHDVDEPHGAPRRAGRRRRVRPDARDRRRRQRRRLRRLGRRSARVRSAHGPRVALSRRRDAGRDPRPRAHLRHALGRLRHRDRGRRGPQRRRLRGLRDRSAADRGRHHRQRSGCSSAARPQRRRRRQPRGRRDERHSSAPPWPAPGTSTATATPTSRWARPPSPGAARWWSSRAPPGPSTSGSSTCAAPWSAPSARSSGAPSTAPGTSTATASATSWWAPPTTRPTGRTPAARASSPGRSARGHRGGHLQQRGHLRRQRHAPRRSLRGRRGRRRRRLRRRARPRREGAGQRRARGRPRGGVPLPRRSHAERGARVVLRRRGRVAGQRVRLRPRAARLVSPSILLIVSAARRGAPRSRRGGCGRWRRRAAPPR